MTHADRGCLIFRIRSPVPLGLSYVLLVETNPFSELFVLFPDIFEFPRYFHDFAYYRFRFVSRFIQRIYMNIVTVRYIYFSNTSPYLFKAWVLWFIFLCLCLIYSGKHQQLLLLLHPRNKSNTWSLCFAKKCLFPLEQVKGRLFVIYIMPRKKCKLIAIREIFLYNRNVIFTKPMKLNNSL